MIDANLIARARDADLVATAEELGARLKRATATELVGPCPRCGGRDRFGVNIRKNTWNCRSCARGGDVIGLVQHALEINFAAAVEFLTGEDTKPSPRAPRSAPTTELDSKEGNAFVERLIAGIVREIVPMRGTPGEQYFADVRKIATDAIADVLDRVDAIGWHPAVLFREQGHPLDGRRLGCIVGIMTDPATARPTGAISRTYVSEGRKVAKAKTLGRPAGIIRLSADEDVLEGLHLAEGMETAVAAMSIGLRPMWATGATSLMAKFPLLSGIPCLNLIVDHDENGAGERAAREAEAHWTRAGREVRLLRSDAHGDFNDALKEAAK